MRPYGIFQFLLQRLLLLLIVVKTKVQAVSSSHTNQNSADWLNLDIEKLYKSATPFLDKIWEERNENERKRRRELLKVDDELLQNHRETASLHHHFRYSLLDSEGIYIALHSLAKTYPEFVKVSSAQDRYGLASLGNDHDCPYEESLESSSKGCKTWIMTIEDSEANPEGSVNYNHLPEVFLSGALHGNERVGPTAVVVTASLLLECARCEALPKGIAPNEEDDERIWDAWEDQLSQARYCRRDLKKRGIYDSERQWLARLVTTRRTVILPTPNALGFYRKVHVEESFDPKTDFPFDSTNATACMQTIAARTVNELFRDHMFQISLTFQAGQVFAAYPWGSPTLLQSSAPDDEAMDQISNALSMYGGSFKWLKENYKTGKLSDLVGPTRGRFEDWAYGASWITNVEQVQCAPTTFGGYDPAKTTYDPSMLRALSFVVDTSYTKNPPKDHLGTDHRVFDPLSTGTGHVPRNLRAALFAIDIVQPYSFILSVNGIRLEEDVIPLAPRQARSCKLTKAIAIPEHTQHLSIQWYVGGGITVDSTALWYAKWSDLPVEFDGATQPSAASVQAFYNEVDGDQVHSSPVRISPGGRGKTQWYREELANEKTKGPLFTSTIDVSSYEEGDEIAVFAVVQCDKSWDFIPHDAEAISLSQQSHLVNSRINPEWHYTLPGTTKEVQGRELWFSIPLTVKVTHSQSVTEEISIRFAHGLSPLQQKEKEAIDVLGILVGIAIVGVVIRYGRKWWNERMKTKGRVYSNILQESEKLGNSVELT